ncbi:hypothetical protein ACQKWADRAFT_288908 [Trichoderma austrokoningii]
MLLICPLIGLLYRYVSALQYSVSTESIAQTRWFFLPIGTALRCSCAISQLNSILQHVPTNGGRQQSYCSLRRSSLLERALGSIALFYTLMLQKSDGSLV